MAGIEGVFFSSLFALCYLKFQVYNTHFQANSARSDDLFPNGKPQLLRVFYAR